MEYNSEKHLILRDIAHQRCIVQEGEYQDFVSRVRNATLKPLKDEFIEVFEVDIPDWPIVKRTPLPIIVFSIGGDGGATQGGPTANMTWDGTQLAVEKHPWVRKIVSRIAKDMAPDRMIPPHRIAYAWQVEEFNPNKHVVIRYWCRDNGVDIVDFWTEFYPQYESDIEIVKTTNPEVMIEKERGSYSPTRRCMLKEHLYVARNHYLGTDEKPDIVEDVVLPQPRMVHDSDDEEEETVEWSMGDGAKTYKASVAIEALSAALGRDVRLFSGTTMDSHIVAISRVAMVRYLNSNPVDTRQYIADTGNRNYDCDDFALTLRSNLIRDYGYNCCAVVAGDVHAWNAFLLNGENGLEVAFIEPQTDGLVEDLDGMYSVQNRCEAIL